MLLRKKERIKSKINDGKRFRKSGVCIVAKKIHPHPKTPNPRCKTKEKKMECMNTTLHFWRREKNQETLMCFCFFGREIW